jgi:predicted nucleotidyltransferase
MNKDFLDILKAFEKFEVEYLVVGAYAVASLGYARATGDLDLWVHATPENAAKVWKGLEQFGAPRSRVTPSDFEQDDCIFQIGVEPVRIDILTSVTGLKFVQAFQRSIVVQLGGLLVRSLSYDDLIHNKLQTGRPKDQLDVLELRRIREHKK